MITSPQTYVLRLLTIFTFCFLTAAHTAFAATYYVDGVLGNDTNNGTSLVTAFKTIEKAESIIAPGDLVRINDGTYLASSSVNYFNISHNGMSGSPITFEAINPGKVIFIATSTGRVMVVNAHYRTFNGIVFDARKISQVAVADASANDRYGIIFIDSIFKNATADGISCAGCVNISDSYGDSNTSSDFLLKLPSSPLSGRTITNVYFSTTTAYGIRAVGDGVSIHDINTSNYVQTQAVVRLENSSDSRVYDSNFTGSGNAAISIASAGGQSNGNIIENVTIVTSASAGYGIAIGDDGVTSGVNTDNNIIRNVNITSQTSGNSVHGVLFGGTTGNLLEKSYISGTGYGLVDKGTFNTIARNNVVNDTPSDNHAFYPKGATNSAYYDNVLLKTSGIGHAVYFANTGTATDTPSTGVDIRNNVIVTGASNNAFRTSGQQEFTSDYNIFQNAGGELVRINNTYTFNTLSSWQASSTHPDSHSVERSALFANESGTFSTTSDFTLRFSSPAIDAGTTTPLHTATSTDFFGNPIYGTPDIGAIEYQPPYTIGTHDVPATGAIRLYADGKFRERVASTTASTSDLAVAPQGGWGSADYREYMDIQIDTWTATSMAWTATSSIATTTVFTIGGLTPNGWYNVQLDAATSSSIGGATCTSSVCEANGSGVLAFTYSGSWSTHSFEVTPGSNPNPSAPGGGGSLLNPGRGKGGKKNTSPSAEDALPVAATTTNAVNAPICTLEEETTTGEVSLVAFVKLLFTTGIIPADKQEKACDALTSASATPSAPAAAAGSFRFTVPLAKGMRSDEVRRLQQFLNTQGFALTNDGLGAPGKETDLFGLLTDDAVKRFQAAYAAEILVPAGLTAPTGYWGQSSIKKANALLGL